MKDAVWTDGWTTDGMDPWLSGMQIKIYSVGLGDQIKKDYKVKSEERRDRKCSQS